VYRVVSFGAIETLPLFPETGPIAGSIDSEEAPITFHASVVASPSIMFLGWARKNLISRNVSGVASAGIVVWALEGLAGRDVSLAVQEIKRISESNNEDSAIDEYRRPDLNSMVY